MAVSQACQSSGPDLLRRRNGPHFAESGSANLGLTDAINALAWVQENIGSFGGDPAKVSIGTTERLVVDALV